ncbi:MAG TPA: EpsI family protein [candidate division Zixibacteria bacterium]|nr:EpsI family protein [candidate division Zixibacteria bacterium]
MEKARIQAYGFGLILVLLLVSGALAYTLRYMKVEPDRMAEFEHIPLQKDRWRGEQILFSDVTYEILKADETTMRTYSSGDELIPVLFIGYFKDQKYGSQIHSPRHCLPGSGWGILSHRREKIEVNGRVLPVNHVIIGAKENRQLMYYWFETRSGTITGEFELKLNLFLNALLMRPTDAAFIRLTVNIPPGAPVKTGEEVLHEFLSDFLTPIENSLPFGSL